MVEERLWGQVAQRLVESVRVVNVFPFSQRAVDLGEGSGELDDLVELLAYLQNQTELTRSTLVRILQESGRLSDFFVNPASLHGHCR